MPYCEEMTFAMTVLCAMALEALLYDIHSKQYSSSLSSKQVPYPIWGSGIHRPCGRLATGWHERNRTASSRHAPCLLTASD